MFKSHLKLIVLKELEKDNLSGYDLMNNIGEFGQKPSPGYIYPLLKDLKKKGFVRVKKSERRKEYSITDKGKKLLSQLEKNQEDMSKKMTKLWKSIADKKEFDEFVNSSIKIQDRMKCYIKDGDLLHRFHKELFCAYKNEEKTTGKKIREVLNETIKKLEDLSHDK